MALDRDPQAIAAGEALAIPVFSWCIALSANWPRRPARPEFPVSMEFCLM